MLHRCIAVLVSLGFVLIFAISCEKKKDDASADNGYTGVAAVALTNIDTVHSGMAPESMLTTQGTATLFSPLMLSDFCGGNFFSCQPKLIKLYLSISKTYVALMKAVLAGLSQGLVDIKDGASDQAGVNIDDYTKIMYSKTSATEFSILAKGISSNETYFYFQSTGTQYNLQIDFGKIPTEQRKSSDPVQGKITVTLNFTDSTHWVLDLFTSGFACDAADPKAPEKIKIITKRNGTIWNGKAMLFNSRSMDTDPTCSTVSTDAKSALTYTEYIGNNEVAKAGVYLMKQNVTGSTSADYSSYTLNNLCATYASNWAVSGGQILCENYLQTQFGEPVSTYTNPFCNLKTTNTPSWNNTCSAYSTEVSSASFDDSEVVWTAPSVLSGTLTITLPTSAL